MGERVENSHDVRTTVTREQFHQVQHAWRQLFDYWSYATSTKSAMFEWVNEIDLLLWRIAGAGDYNRIANVLTDDVLNKASKYHRRDATATDNTVPTTVVSTIRRVLSPPL